MIKQQIQKDLVQALKNKDQPRLATLRFILSQIQNKEIEKQKELNDGETVNVIKKFAKELNESIEAFQKGNRPDLLEESQKQLAIVHTYLPPEISDEELKSEVEKIIRQNQDLYNKNPKAIIGISIKALRDKADSGRIMKMLSSL
jgi:uncharacterized protein